MRQEIATEWTKLLRSGEFKQGGGALRTGDDQYCCLGVLCEMAAREGVIPAGILSSVGCDWYRYGTEWTHSTSVLPYEVQAWAGMTTDTGLLPDGEELTALNDSGTPFVEIADLIDAKYETL